MQEIIDFHAHIYPDKIAAKATDSIGDFYNIPMSGGCGSVEKLLETGKKAGTTRYVVHSVATSVAQVHAINEFIAEQCRLHPEMIGFGTYHPDMTPDEAEKDLDHILALGLRGVKVHPDFQRFRIDDRRQYPFYEMLCARGVPILFHTGDYRYDFSGPERLGALVRDFPRLTAIGAHFAGWSEWETVLERITPSENLWVDCSSSLAFLEPEYAARLVRHFGAEKVLYGTDFPMWRADEERERFDRLPLTEEERQMILCGNAKRLLKLE